ncbi:MAG: hypothetical protein JHD28_02685, partial [Bacteroidia bacterium]|nr:hypothetical protein [Bacteroidia bacterium]
KLPNKLSNKWIIISKEIGSINLETLPENTRTYKTFKWLGVIFTLVFIVTILWLNGEKKWDAVFIVFRTLAVIGLLYFVVAPFIKHLIKKYSANRQNQINDIVNDLPQIKQTAQLAFALASKNKKGISKYLEFVWILITLTLYHEA